MGDKTNKTVICGVLSVLIGLGILATGIGLFFGFPVILNGKIKENVPLTVGTTSFSEWKSPPVPVFMQFWVWDLKNKNDVIQNGSKPVIQQKGPFTYREARKKDNITFHDKNHTLSYTEEKGFIFESSSSVGLENETFITVNLPVIVIAEAINSSKIWKWLPEYLKNEVISYINRSDALYKEYTVHEYLWGFSDPIITKINKLIPHSLRIANKFGLFASTNGNDSFDGMYEIYTGKDDVSKVNVIKTWKNMTHLTYWNPTYPDCNMINGTDGTLFPPFVKKSDILRFFSSDICRSIYATFVREYSLEGINLYRFVPPKAVFEDPRINPANKGFCTTQCFKAGVLDISVCKNGVPIIMSQPHFYQADPGYINAVKGVNPIRSQHQTFLDIEPMTGAVMHVAKRLQINAYLTPNAVLEQTKQLKNPIIFPLVWLNETAIIDKTSADKFKHEVFLPILIATVAQYVLIGLGAIIVFVVVVVTVIKIVKHRKKQLTPGDGKAGLISAYDQ